MPQLAFMVLMLVVVLVGMLLMTQILNFEPLGIGMWRLFFLVMLVGVGAFLLKFALLPILVCVLVLLKRLVFLGLAIVMVLIATIFVLRLVFMKLANRNARPHRRNEDL